MTLTLTQTILKHLGIKAFTPEGNEIKCDEQIKQTRDDSIKEIKVYVPKTGEKVYEALHTKKKGLLGLSHWSLVYSWHGPNEIKYLLFNNRY